MSSSDLSAVWLTVQLATVTTVLLFLLSAPLAWWLSRTLSLFKPIVEAVTTLPLVLPPTVLGFYFLVVFNPHAPIGSFFVWVTGESLTFSFQGLVIASMIYSLPFMVQPLRIAFEKVDPTLQETALVLGANRWESIRHVVWPASVRGILSAFVLTFAHTVGEFGVVLMIGGNIPNETRVVSIALFEHVETLNYTDAHVLAICLITFSLMTLIVVYTINRSSGREDA